MSACVLRLELSISKGFDLLHVCLCPLTWTEHFQRVWSSPCLPMSLELSISKGFDLLHCLLVSLDLNWAFPKGLIFSMSAYVPQFELSISKGFDLLHVSLCPSTWTEHFQRVWSSPLSACVPWTKHFQRVWSSPLSACVLGLELSISKGFDLLHVCLCPLTSILYPLKGGRGCLMSPPCLESQGCHLIPLCCLLSCSSA